jgi:endonuclease G
VFNDQWDVVALHHSGIPATDDNGNLLDVDGNVWRDGDDPARLEWIGNEGIRVSRLVAFIKDARVKEHEKALRDALLETGESQRRTRPVDEPEQPDRDETSRRESPRDDGDASLGRDHPLPAARAQAGALTFTVPLTITVALGDAASGRGAAFSDAPGKDLLEAVRPDPNYRNRRGFEANFLGVRVPLPQPTNTIAPKVLRVGDGVELKYHRYSVIMNRARRLAFVSAVNIDADAPVQYRREGKDSWHFDPRIGEEFQADNEFYADNPLDRGHLTRRADAAWGATEAEAKRANDDTFHWTNCAPQHEIFNQSTRAERKGMRLWGNLENHIAEQAEARLRKLSVFNGPIFRDSGRGRDRNHRGLLLPKEFWKVICYRDKERTLGAVAFVLSQESLIKNLPEEEFVIGPYKPFQVKIRDIESRTKLDFGDLYKSDPLERPGAEESFETGTELVPLQSASDIVL